KQAVIIGWKGIPRLFIGINRRAAVLASNAIGRPGFHTLVFGWVSSHSDSSTIRITNYGRHRRRYS
ncbi:MAG TPA: hypothetical protein QGF86_05010, partial [Nitrospinaceae bacterium]|nr:hypothetical protein [Nitrospinaceae bacterium]